MAEFRLKGHRYRPPCCVGSEQPRRKPAPGKVTLEDAVDLLALAAPLSRPPDQLICRNAPVGHHSEDLVPASVGQLHRGERKLHLPLHSRQRLFDQPLPGSYEPILRAVLGVPYLFGYEVHISPLLTRVHTMLPNLAVQRLPVLLGDLGHRSADSAVTSTPTANSITPNRSSLPSAQYRSAGTPPQTAASPFPPPQADGPALQSTLATGWPAGTLPSRNSECTIWSASDQ